MAKSIKGSTLYSILLSILFATFWQALPTKHYEERHSDVEWELVLATLLTPTRWRPNRRRGKGRYTYEKEFDGFAVEVHIKIEVDGTAWVINAFKNRR